MKKLAIFSLSLAVIVMGCRDQDQPNQADTEILYTMPDESSLHEGTWLQWPHHHQYGVDYRDDLDPSWVAMTEALTTGEKVHIIAYDQTELDRITTLLSSSSTNMAQVDFFIYPNEDVWVRDNGPIFARDSNGALVIQDWGFNGWGEKTDDFTGEPIQWVQSNEVPTRVANDIGKTLVDLNTVMVNEGGAVEVDGNGTLMACKSSILNNNRNPGMTQAEAEVIFTTYLGVTNFIWLDGRTGLDITDQHIDGFARFADPNTIVTMERNDLLDYDVRSRDIDVLMAATNKDGNSYTFVTVPLTQNNVVKPDGTNLGYKGSYVNFYSGNSVVLVPNYNDPNDAVANAIIQGIYPDRTVVGIDMRSLYENGGMVHCVTQQQPVD